MIINDYHISVPHLSPTPAERQWAMENVYSTYVEKALREIPYRQGRLDFDQNLLKTWSMYPRICEYFDALGIKIRRFSAMWHRSRPDVVDFVHMDTYREAIPLTGRFNIPIQGQTPAVIHWWNSGYDDLAGQWRIIEKRELKPDGSIITGKGGLHSDRDWTTVPPDFEVQDPGTCWNRTDVGHRMRYTGSSDTRFLITVEMSLLPDGQQWSWEEIVKRNRSYFQNIGK